MQTRFNGHGRGKTFFRSALSALFIGLLAFSVACQTPPPKSNRNAAAARNGGSQADSSSSKDFLNLFSASAEVFGTDPRSSRPALVTTTAFAAVGGAAVLLAGAVVVSAVRGARGRGPRRGRSRSA